MVHHAPLLATPPNHPTTLYQSWITVVRSEVLKGLISTYASTLTRRHSTAGCNSLDTIEEFSDILVLDTGSVGDRSRRL